VKAQPFSQRVPYFAKDGTLTQVGAQHLNQWEQTINSSIGSAPIVTARPTQPGTLGQFVFEPGTGTLYLFDGSVWKGIVLT
jgi:hypothetical protein